MRTRPHIRRALQLLTVTALTVTVATGCARLPDEPTTAGPTTAAPAEVSVDDLTAALTSAAAAVKAKPYSAALQTQSLSDGQLAASSTGTVNLTDPLTGRLEVRTTDLDGAEPLSVVEVLTADTIYLRSIEDDATATTDADADPDGAGGWQHQDRAGSSTGTIPDLFGYAQLLLQAGPSVVAAEEPQNGAPATRLSGRITTEQLSTLDPDAYQRLKTGAVDGVDCDLWVDREGRVVRFEQRLTYQGKEIRTLVALSQFGDPVPVEPPAP